MHPEIEVKLTASVAGCASCDLMAQLSREVNELDAADVLIREVIDFRGATSLAESTHQALEVDVRVRIGEGARACLNLSSVTLEKMASISASLNFDPELTGDGGADGLELEGESAPSTRPELVVVLVGDSPVSGEEVILSRIEHQLYRTGDIQSGVHEVLQRGLERVEGEARVWALQVGVRLSSQRGVWPGFNLSWDVIRLMASGGVSLDFDPYV
ncbi:hypothetical protein [Stenotrophomonas maltophilia]|uniref:hypothetical protein n=1 Tax=Stenotrophomonas maltophilia TaxID=40324 RepID=UPI0013D8E9B5|nr:hypothetical protein [Stenotrophomonas maltophilia]